MSHFKNIELAPIDGAAPNEVQANRLKAPGLWERVTRFERCDWEILALAFDLAGASPQVRAEIQAKCKAAHAEYKTT